MTLVSRNFQDRPILTPREHRRVTEAAASRIEIEADSVAFVYVEDQRMRWHHQRYLGADTTTDVLSFPAGEEGPGGGRHLGDVMICTDQALRQALELGHPYGTELTVLALHGVLHLAGFDHVTDRGEMRSLEEVLRPRAIPSLGGIG